MNEGAGTKSLGAWACPPARVARNCAVSGDGTTEFEAGSAADGVWAMSCAHGRRARRARRTRVGFFMLHLLVDGPAGDRPASKEIGVSKAGKEALDDSFLPKWTGRAEPYSEANGRRVPGTSRPGAVQDR